MYTILGICVFVVLCVLAYNAVGKAAARAEAAKAAFEAKEQAAYEAAAKRAQSLRDRVGTEVESVKTDLDKVV
jgi:hypothetical protein